MDFTAWPWNALVARAARVGKTVRYRGEPAGPSEIRLATDNPLELVDAIERIEGAAVRRLHPRISLIVCHQCFGRGSVLAVRNRQAVSEACTQCAGKGSIVHDDAGAIAA
jgi:hypothetical protein